MLSNTIDQGTKTRSARQIAEEIQAAGGDVSTGSGKDSTVLSTEVLSSKADAAIALLADLAQNASFPDNEVALAKRNLADVCGNESRTHRFWLGVRWQRFSLGTILIM